MGAGAQFHSIEVAHVQRQTEDTLSLTLSIPASLADAFRYRSGQFLSVRIPGPHGALVRSYSLSSSPVCDAAPVITVRRVVGGQGSSWLHTHVRAGDPLDVSTPQGRFVLSDSQKDVVMIAGGSGITPCMSMMKTLLATSGRNIHLIYASKSAGSIIFHDALHRQRAAFETRLTCHFHISANHAEDARAVFFARILPEPDREYYICGAPAFVESVSRHLTGAGVPAEAIHVEAFSSPGEQQATTPVSAIPDVMLKITLDGSDSRVPVAEGQTLLDAAMRGAIDVPHSCQSGHCGACMAMLRAGSVVQSQESRALSRNEIDRGYVLACQCRAASAEIWLDYDA